MEKEIVYLGKDKKEYLVAYLPTFSDTPIPRKKLPAVVICPGGGYTFCSEREADPVAEVFLSAGYAVFTVYYSLGDKAAYPIPLVDLSRSMKIVRENADKWGVLTDEIAVCGFSAGGHLAASLGVYWNDPEIKKLSGCENGENKPNAMILIYPVLSCSWPLNGGKEKLRNYLIGDRDYDAQFDRFSLYRHVNADTPQAFICHTFRDTAVPVEDSLHFADAMAKADIPFEMHIFPNGGHGLSTGAAFINSGKEEPSFKQWTSLCVSWLVRKFGNPDEANAPIRRSHFNPKA